MDFATFLVRAIGDTLFNTPPTHATKDIFNRVKDECKPNKVTECVLKAMFCESTGSHFLDSGGAYGRGWERAQAVKDQDWMTFPYINKDIHQYSDGRYELSLTKNTYQFLCDKLKYDIEMDKVFHQFANKNKDSYYSNMDDFVRNPDEWEIDNKIWNIDSNVEDYKNLGGYNTYNGESCLDKTLQWNIFAIYNGELEGHYMILQIHNGCDVRGGYSTPHVFTFDEDEFYCWLSDLSIRCPNHGNSVKEDTMQKTLDGKDVPPLDHVDCYSDDGGYHWYPNSGSNEWKFITDENEEHKVVCGNCEEELNFY